MNVYRILLPTFLRFADKLIEDSYIRYVSKCKPGKPITTSYRMLFLTSVPSKEFKCNAEKYRLL